MIFRKIQPLILYIFLFAFLLLIAQKAYAFPPPARLICKIHNCPNGPIIPPPPAGSSEMKIIDTPSPYLEYKNASPNIKGDTSTDSRWEFALTDEQKNTLANNDNATIEMDLTVTVKLQVCENHGGLRPVENLAFFEIDGSAFSSPASKTIYVTCPLLTVTGDTGSTAGSISDTSKIAVTGPAVVIAQGSISNLIEGSNIIKMEEYNFNNDIKNKLKNQFNALWREAKNWDLRGSDPTDLNPDNKPGGGVWKKETGSVTLNSSYKNKGTLMADGNITLSAGFTGTSTQNSSMGIYSANGDVIITGDAGILEIQNVAIYAPNGTIRLENTGPFTFSGMMVAKDIYISETDRQPGNIKWSAQVAKYPPPGFTDLMDTSDLVEKPPI